MWQQEWTGSMKRMGVAVTLELGSSFSTSLIIQPSVNFLTSLNLSFFLSNWNSHFLKLFGRVKSGAHPCCCAWSWSILSNCDLHLIPEDQFNTESLAISDFLDVREKNQDDFEVSTWEFNKLRYIKRGRIWGQGMFSFGFVELEISVRSTSFG